MTEQRIALLAGERADRESDAAAVACNDYLRLGPGRSIAKLVQKYAEADQEAPSQSIGVVKGWSTRYGWQERASAYDADVERQKTAEISRLRSEGLAADYERLRELSDIYGRLRDELEQTGLWYDDIKLSSRGDRVTVKVFNKSLLDTMRGVLDDIAKEVGGRKQRHEHSGPDGGPVQIQAVEDALLKVYDDDDDSDAPAAHS